METGAVVVAAGMSSRMGDFKPMLSVGTISIAQRVLATLHQAGVNRIVVVTGFRADELERHLARSGAVFLRNENYRTTHMFDSALIGLSYILGKCDRALFTPVDIPLFTSSTLEALLESGAELAAPEYGGRSGHPIMMSSAVIERVLRDSGEGGLHGALTRCGTPMRLIPVSDPGILLDADTPEDYAELLELHNSQLFRPVLDVGIARERKFLDNRVAMLLSLTDETSSVRLACQRMQLSYSAGWNAINLLERELGCAVVERSQGGAHGGRSRLTARGRELLDAYQNYTRALRDTAARLFEENFPELAGKD